MGHPLTVQPQVLATGTTGPTVETERGHLPRATDQRHTHRLEEADRALQAVAPGPQALAATAGAHREGFQAHRITALQHLGVRQPRVSHVRLQPHRSSKALTRAATTGHRFVVLAAAIAEADVVHRSLAGRLGAESRKQQIAEGLRHLHVAGHHSGGGPRI